MKKYLLVYIFMIGCSSNAPEDLISEEKMESIIFLIVLFLSNKPFLLFNERTIETPTINRKLGNMQSVGVNPFQSAWSNGAKTLSHEPG